MRESPTIMVVGAGWDQAPIIQQAKRQGYFVVAVDGDPNAYGLRFADKWYVVSTRDVEGVLKVAREERVDAITYMITESPLYAIRRVCDELGLPGPSARSVEATVSKFKMRQIFAQAGIPNPRFGLARNVDEAMALAETIRLPLVMKPSDLGGQLGLAKIVDVQTIPEYFERASTFTVGEGVILEELLVGPEVNVVALVVRGNIEALTISDRITHPSMGFGVVLRHLYPTSCSEQIQSDIRLMCQKVVNALEISNGIIFPQIIITKDGPRIVEIGVRIPGGVMKELFEEATGYDLVKFQIDISFGRPIHLSDYKTRRAHRAVTVKFLTAQPGPLRPGKISRLVGVEKALSLEGIVKAEYYNDPTKEQIIRPVKHGRDRVFFIIAVGDTREEVVERSNVAASMIDFLDENGSSLKLVGHEFDV